MFLLCTLSVQSSYQNVNNPPARQFHISLVLKCKIYLTGTKTLQIIDNLARPANQTLKKKIL